MGIISWLVVGAVAGWLAGMLVEGDERFGAAGHIVIGIVGAVIGGLLTGLVTGGDYVNGFDLATVIVATIGAVISIAAWNAISGGQAGGRVV